MWVSPNPGLIPSFRGYDFDLYSLRIAKVESVVAACERVAVLVENAQSSPSHSRRDQVNVIARSSVEGNVVQTRAPLFKPFLRIRLAKDNVEITAKEAFSPVPLLIRLEAELAEQPTPEFELLFQIGGGQARGDEAHLPTRSDPTAGRRGCDSTSTTLTL
jgi:hypothetical protein